MLGWLVALSVGAHMLTPTPDTRVIVADQMPTALQTSDAAPVQALYVVYEPAWREALLPLLQAAGRLARVIVNPEDEVDAREFLRLAQTEIVVMPHDSPWVRDYAPLQKRDKHTTSWVRAQYHPSRARDAAFEPARDLHGAARAAETVPYALEGGGIVSNGAGLCAMTWSTFAGMALPLGDPRWERALHRLGCGALAIAPQPNGETTGHVDLLAQFTASDRVAVSAGCEHVDTADMVSLDNLADALKDAATALGLPLAVVRVPMHVDLHGIYFSHVNAVRINAAWLVPRYDTVPEHERAAALTALAQAAPDAVVSPVAADSFNAMGGALHCITWGLADHELRP